MSFRWFEFDSFFCAAVKFLGVYLLIELEADAFRLSVLKISCTSSSSLPFQNDLDTTSRVAQKYFGAKRASEPRQITSGTSHYSGEIKVKYPSHQSRNSVMRESYPKTISSNRFSGDAIAQRARVSRMPLMRCHAEVPSAFTFILWAYLSRFFYRQGPTRRTWVVIFFCWISLVVSRCAFVYST